jgi:hypothetical protein
MTVATNLSTPATDSPASETRWAVDAISELIDRCPRRQPTSSDERRAALLVQEWYRRAGLQASLHEFTFNDNLYANLALHFGLSSAAALVSPLAPALAAAVASGVAISYAADSSRRGFLLRRAFPFRRSQSVVATLPSIGERKVRVVFVSHIDAAFTGTMFEAWFVQRFAPRPGPLYKGLRVATGSVAALGVLAAAMSVSPAVRRSGRWLSLPLGLPSMLAAGLNMNMLYRNRIVPGAADNLSAVAGGLLLAQRLLHARPEHVEFVFASVGCEEASLGGSDALAAEMSGAWSTDDTFVIGIDGFCNGELRWFREGEVFPIASSTILEGLIQELAAEPRWSELAPLDIPVGGTDAIPFLVRGYHAMTLGCVDPARGTPREYHQVTDDVQHMNPEKISECVDLCEQLVWRLAGRVVSGD